MGAEDQLGVPLRRLEHRYVFDHRIANCSSCPLLPRRDDTICLSQRPELFNGLMIVGEGPGANEARLKVPFVGRSGALLEKLLEMSGIKREHTYISNATLCMPTLGAKDKEVAGAIPACRNRLLAEIEELQPRVILALGGGALSSLTGKFTPKVKRLPKFRMPDGTPLACPQCAGDVTLPWWKCTCKEPNILPPTFSQYCGQLVGIDGGGGLAQCVSCGLVHDTFTVEVRKKRCPTCLGRKTEEVEIQEFGCDHKISFVSGLVFRGRYAADFAAMDPEAQVDLPCHYVIPTYHPAFLLRQPEGQTKKPTGQFLVNASLAHLRKAARLLREDAKWKYSYFVVPDHLQRDVVHLPEESSERRTHEAIALGQTLEMIEVYFKQQGELFTSVDIETDNKDPWQVTDIRCVGFHRAAATQSSSQENASFVVNTAGLPRNHPIVQMLIPWLTSLPTKCFQNGLYDIQVLWHIWGVEVEGYQLDTLVAHNAVHHDAPHDLQHIAGCYTDSPPWKPAKKKGDKEIWESSEQLHRYNGRDCYNTTLSMMSQLGELEAEQARFVHDLDVQMFHCARDMERAGLPINPERWQRWRDRAIFYKTRAETIIRNYAGRDDLNLHATPQIQWLLFDKSGPCRFLPLEFTDPSTTHPNGQPSTSKSAIATYKGHPVVDLLIDYRRWDGLLSRNIDGMPLGMDWRIRTRWNPLLKTGRWSSKPNLQNWGRTLDMLIGVWGGINRDGKPEGGPYRLEIFPGDERYLSDSDKLLLEIPGIREAVVVPPGRKIVGADLSQAELRVLGAVSGDQTLISLCMRADEARKLEPEWDPHSYVAAMAFGQGYTGADPSTKPGARIRKRLRDLVKRVVYGLMYGSGADTILAAIYDGGYDGPPIDKATIELLIKTVFKAFPRVREWRERELQEAKRTGRVTDALIGRRREFPLLLIDPTIAYNFKIQSTVGSMMSMSMLELRHRLQDVDPSAMIFAQVHDAVYVDAAEDRAEAVAHLLEEVMSQSLQLVPGASFMDFPASAKIADDWYQAA